MIINSLLILLLLVAFLCIIIQKSKITNLKETNSNLYKANQQMISDSHLREKA